MKRLQRLNVRSLLALRASGHIELDALVFLQRLKAAGLDCREVSEQIFAAFVRGDKAKTFGVIEPLNSTCCHCISYLSKLCGIVPRKDRLNQVRNYRLILHHCYSNLNVDALYWISCVFRVKSTII